MLQVRTKLRYIRNETSLQQNETGGTNVRTKLLYVRTKLCCVKKPELCYDESAIYQDHTGVIRNIQTMRRYLKNENRTKLGHEVQFLLGQFMYCHAKYLQNKKKSSNSCWIYKMSPIAFGLCNTWRHGVITSSRPLTCRLL